MLGEEKFTILKCNITLSGIFPDYRLEASNIFEFPIKWQKNSGLDPDNNSTHSQYLTSMCEKFSSTLESKIANTASLLRVQTSNTVYQEVLHHGACCQEHVQKFMVSQLRNMTFGLVNQWCTYILVLDYRIVPVSHLAFILTLMVLPTFLWWFMGPLEVGRHLLWQLLPINWEREIVSKRWQLFYASWAPHLILPTFDILWGASVNRSIRYCL